MKIAYVNPWSGFDQKSTTDSFIISRMLREAFPDCEIQVGIDGNPDLAISLYYPMEGSPHYADMSRIRCKKIAFTGESYDIVAVTPGCDAYIGFDQEQDMPSDVMSLRLPLYAVYHQDHLDRHGCGSFEELRERFQKEKIRKVSAVVSNSGNSMRTSLIEYLVRGGFCDSGGRVCNNVGEVSDKLDFTSKYAAALAFENLAKKSYITEKIYEAFIVNSVPIYWGADDIELEFNPNSYIRFDSTNQESVNQSMAEIFSLLSDKDRLHMMSSADPITEYRAEKYIRDGRQIFKDFVMKVVDTK